MARQNHPRKILFVVPYTPNLIRVRPYNLIRHLALRGHKVTVATLYTDDREKRSLEDLRGIAERVEAVNLPRWRSLLNVLSALPGKDPLQSAYCWQPAFAQKLSRLISGQSSGSPFDVIHIEHLRGIRYGLFLKRMLAERGVRIPIVWDSVDSISYLFRQATVESKSLISRTITRFELARTERYEAWLLGQFDRVLVTSPSDRKAFLDLVPNGAGEERISILPNGVDLDYFQPNGSGDREPFRLVVSGKMSYHANVTMVLELVEKVMPAVWSRRPEANLWVVGKDPTRELQALQANPRIQVTGTVDHLPPYLRKAAVAVAPIAYGAGIQNKVLESMGCATPVVASPQAISALQVVPDRDLLVAEGPDAFAEAVLCLLDDQERRMRLGLAGRRYVEEHHHWNSVARRLETLYEQLL